MHTGRTSKSSAIAILQLTLLFCATCVFFIRGPLRSNTAGDLATPYVSATRYRQHADPYTERGFQQDWDKAGIGAGNYKDALSFHPVYPPSTLLIAAPFTRLSWRAARHFYAGGCTVLYLLLLIAISRNARYGSRYLVWPRVGFLFFGLALSPMLTAINTGNLSTPALLFAISAVLLTESRLPVLGGVVLGLSCALKPTVGAAFILYYFAVLNWQVALTGCACAIALALTGIYRLQQFAPLWRVHYNENITAFFGTQGANSWSGNSLARFDLLNLQLPLYEFTHSIRASNGVTYAAFGFLTLLWLFLTWRNRRHGPSWAPVAAISLLCLLPVYQRNYNASVAVLAIAWASQNVPRRSARSIFVLALIALFPVEAYLRGSVYPRLPAWLTGSVLWRGVFMPQLTWAVVGMILCLLAAMSHDLYRERGSQIPAA